MLGAKSSKAPSLTVFLRALVPDDDFGFVMTVDNGVRCFSNFCDLLAFLNTISNSDDFIGADDNIACF